MRNELYLSNEVALDGSSWQLSCFDEEAYPRILQASDNVIKGVAVNRQGTSTLVMHSEGDGTVLKSSLCLPLPPSVSLRREKQERQQE